MINKKAMKDGNVTVFRTKEENKVKVNPDIFTSKLNAESIVVMLYISGKDEDWRFDREEVSNETGLTFHKIAKATKELQERGYLFLDKTRSNGKYDAKYYFYDSPSLNPHFKNSKLTKGNE